MGLMARAEEVSSSTVCAAETGKMALSLESILAPIKSLEDKTYDYKTASYLGGLADYITVNISSPNTPGLRDLQDADALRRTLEATFDGLKEADVTPPVFVKLTDLTQSALWQSLEAVGHYPVKGLF